MSLRRGKKKLLLVRSHFETNKRRYLTEEGHFEFDVNDDNLERKNFINT
jgi:hypothetical protein